MIKLFSLKQEKEKEDADAAANKPKVAPGLIRMQKGARRRRTARGCRHWHDTLLSPLGATRAAPRETSLWRRRRRYE